MIRTLFHLAIVAAALAACSPQSGGPNATSGEAAAQTAARAFDQSAAEAQITAWARGQFNAEGTGLIEPVASFFGDFTGDGAPDAIAFSYIDTGGSAANLDVSLFRNDAGHMTHVRQVEVWGQEPRDVAFSVGRITLTTTMPKPGDPHCCPTGSQQWTVATN